MTAEIKFLSASIVSLALIVFSVIYFIKRMKNHGQNEGKISPFNVIVIMAFIAIFINFLPISFSEQISEGTSVAPVLISVYYTMRVFLFDGDYELLKNVLIGLSNGVRIWFYAYTMALYTIAPILTAGFALSMFKSINAQMRYKTKRNRPTFIFSHLNEKSFALARSIAENKEIKNPVIVFADVYDSTREEMGELVSQADKMHAILMPKGINDINVEYKKGRLEMFYISENESENVNMAIDFIGGEYSKKYKKVNGKKVALKYNERKNTKVFVFAENEGNARIIDSLDVCNSYEGISDENFKNGKFPDDSEFFKVRRVDTSYILARNLIENADIFGKYTEKDGERVISVLLLGLGKLGKMIFRTLVWYGQMQGYRLEINVVDAGNTAVSELGHICPEILSTNNKKVDGDAFYSIEFNENVNVFSDSWDKLIGYNGADEELLKRAERLRRSTVAFVALGDDDKNIRASVELRKFFDRAGNSDSPEIYSMVYDEQKSSNLMKRPLTTHNNQAYNINFSGALSSRFNYSEIYPEKLEKEAFDKCHMSWSYYSVYKDIAEIERRENRKLSLEEKEKIVTKERKKQIALYDEFEYFRNSSMSKAMHKKLIAEKFADKFLCDNSGYECNCEKCWARRRNEHNRWNSYIRSQGYIYAEKKSDRARTHNNLVPFDMLDEETQRLD